LLAVLRCFVDDLRSLCSAARAHSLLHQAAVMAMNIIDSTIPHEQQMAGILLYLDRHGRHVDSLDLLEDSGVESTGVCLRQLPSNLQLSDLLLLGMELQLQPGNGVQGVLGAVGSATLKKLRLANCKLLDGGEGLAAALSQMPGREHLGVNCYHINDSTGGLQVSV
jgi:hypothetical protein